MNFSVLGEHRDFFRKQHWIQCEQVLSAVQLEKLLAGLEAAFSVRLKQAVSLKSDSFLRAYAAELLLKGRNLWRESGKIKSILLHRNLAELAAQLIEVSSLRFAYDQFLPVPFINSSCLNTPQALDQISSVQGILCGAIICLKSPGVQDNTLSELSFFPLNPGDAVFFQPTFPVPFDQLPRFAGYSFMIIAYAKPAAVFCFQDKDNFSHVFKEYGYNFGDRLKEPHNPLVYP
jgi:hypothetical protein